VTDALGNNVQVFDPEGREILGFGAHGLGAGQFRLPAGICVTSNDVIYVVDSINLRIQEFRYLSPSKETGS
jgi:DNA-binding beta-propeller fold protein YncE